MHKLGNKTQRGYIRTVRKFVGCIGRSPDNACLEDLRNFRLRVVNHGVSPITLNTTIAGLKFFFAITLDRAGLMIRMRPVHVPHQLPVIPSRQEVTRLIAAAGNLKHQTALPAAQGAGLRISEVVAMADTADRNTWGASKQAAYGRRPNCAISDCVEQTGNPRPILALDARTQPSASCGTTRLASQLPEQR